MTGIIATLATVGLFISVVLFFAALIPTPKNRARDPNARSFRLRLWSGMTGLCFLIWYAAVSRMQPEASQPPPQSASNRSVRLHGGLVACPTKELLGEFVSAKALDNRDEQSRLLNSGCFITKPGAVAMLNGDSNPNGFDSVMLESETGKPLQFWTSSANIIFPGPDKRLPNEANSAAGPK